MSWPGAKLLEAEGPAVVIFSKPTVVCNHSENENRNAVGPPVLRINANDSDPQALGQHRLDSERVIAIAETFFKRMLFMRKTVVHSDIMFLYKTKNRTRSCQFFVRNARTHFPLAVLCLEVPSAARLAEHSLSK